MCRHIHIYHLIAPHGTRRESLVKHEDEDDVQKCKVIFDKCETARWEKDCGGSTVEEVIIERDECQWCTLKVLRPDF